MTDENRASTAASARDAIVWLVDVPGRDDGIYVFAEEPDALAYADAACIDPELCVNWYFVNNGSGAADLIAAERQS